MAMGAKTDKRSATILPSYVGKQFMVHNGKTHNPVLVTEEMVGYKLGEFSRTRKDYVYKRK